MLIRQVGNEKGSVLTELGLVIASVSVVALAALPSVKQSLQTLQTAQYNANKINTSYPPALINSSSMTHIKIPSGKHTISAPSMF